MPGSPSLIAHRGFAGVYPENTVAAVRRAVGAPPDRRPDCVEIDVMPTADDEVVVIHDHTPGRVTDAPPELADRRVWELSFETLRGFDVLGSGEPIPRLEEVVEAVPPDVRLNVEFKNPGTADLRFAENLPRADRARQRDRWRPFVERTLDRLARHPHDLVASSFYEGALAAVREVDPSVPIATILYDSVADGLAVARRYDAEAIHPPLNMIPGTDLFNADYRGLGPFVERDLVAIARDEGRELNAWTVETWHQAAELRRAGIDGVIADYPGVVRFDAGREQPAERA